MEGGNRAILPTRRCLLKNFLFLMLAGTMLATVGMGCAARSPFAETGPVVTRTIVTTTTDSTVTSREEIVEKTRAAAELEYRLAVLQKDIAKAQALAMSYRRAYGLWPVGYITAGVNVDTGSGGGTYRGSSSTRW